LGLKEGEPVPKNALGVSCVHLSLNPMFKETKPSMIRREIIEGFVSFG